MTRAFARWQALAGLVVCIVCSTATLGAQAQAQTGHAAPASEYESLIDGALAAFRRREFSRARALFEQAHARQPSARTLRGLGVTAVELRNYESAEDELEAALADPRRPLTPEQRLEVTELLEWMRASLGTLQLELTPPSAIARIDDRRTAARTLRLDPGEHALEVRAGGYHSHAQRFSLDRGQKLALQIALEPESVARSELPVAPQPIAATAARSAGDPRDESSSVFERWWFWTTVGVVAVGGAIAIVALTADPGQKPFESGGVSGVLETLRVQR